MEWSLKCLDNEVIKCYILTTTAKTATTTMTTTPVIYKFLWGKFVYSLFYWFAKISYKRCSDNIIGVINNGVDKQFAQIMA